MVEVPQQLVEIGEYFGVGFQPVLIFDGWRVAMKRAGVGTSAAKFHAVDRHNETNEVFVLTAGQADMLLMEGGDVPTEFHLFPMELNVAYSVQQSAWHHVFMSDDAHIIVFERANTARENSNSYELDADTIAAIRSRVRVG
ncbi:MAG: hypothetical protein IT328_05245 [Caldilineaceae bacterium]|nr:hypothetical protein [Caldilineaceae bacterium]